jgi:hypothetical protein
MVVVGPTRDVVVVVDLAWCSDGGGGSGTVLCWWLRHMVRVTPMCSMVVAPTCGGGTGGGGSGRPSPSSRAV